MPQYELNFRDYWRIIHKRKLVVILAFSAVLFSSILFTKTQIPIYQATATIRIEQYQTMPQLFLEEFYWAPSNPLANQARIVKSLSAAEEVVRRLGRVREGATPEEITRAAVAIQNMISSQEVPEDNILRIIVTSANSKEAAQIANTMAQVSKEIREDEEIKRAHTVRVYIEEQLNETKKRLTDAEESLKRFRVAGKGTGLAEPLAKRLVDLRFELSSLLRQYTEEHPRIIRLKEEIAIVKKELETLLSEDIDLKPLLRELNIAESAYAMLDGKYREALINEEKERVKVITIIGPAGEPRLPVKPNMKRNVAVGGIIGLMLGLAFAFMVESLDTSIAAVEDVEDYLKIPVLGIIPHIRIGEEKTRLRRPRRRKPIEESQLRFLLIPHYKPKSTVAEAYRTLRTNIQSIQVAKKGNSLLFTSTGSREGKSLTMVNCGVVMAQAGKKTLLIESDMRRPFIHKLFGLKREPGLTDVLVGSIKWERALRITTDISLGRFGLEDVLLTPGLENLSILTCGYLPPNPTELLNSPQMTNLIEELKAKFDILLFDSAPVLPVADSVILGPKLDGVILVYEVGRTARGALRRAKGQLEDAKATVWGIVLNNILASELRMLTDYYAYYYQYYLEEEKEVSKGRKILSRLGPILSRKRVKKRPPLGKEK